MDWNFWNWDYVTIYSKNSLFLKWCEAWHQLVWSTIFGVIREPGTTHPIQLVLLGRQYMWPQTCENCTKTKMDNVQLYLTTPNTMLHFQPASSCCFFKKNLFSQNINLTTWIIFILENNYILSLVIYSNDDDKAGWKQWYNYCLTSQIFVKDKLEEGRRNLGRFFKRLESVSSIIYERKCRAVSM